MSEHTVELDCAPGYVRPGDLIADVLKDTGLPVRDPIYKVFGNWAWDFSDHKETFEAAKPVIQERIEKLYHNGTIRYGSW